MEEKTDREILAGALLAAKEEFEEYIESKGFDPTYFSLDLEGYLLSDEFRPYRHSIELRDMERQEDSEE